MNRLKARLPARIKSLLRCWQDRLFDRYSLRCYSQEGEDIILRRIFERETKGFYIDVGAHHPRRFSNTYLFYQQGWSGINIDAAPGSMRLFSRLRPRDINLEVAVAESGEARTFFIFEDPALNTFDAELAQTYTRHHYRLLETRAVRTLPLKEILTAHIPAYQRINFLSVDVEGFDLQVLRSNDWQLFRPQYVLAEYAGLSTMKQAQETDVGLFLNAQGYELFAKTLNTLVFRDSAF